MAYKRGRSTHERLLDLSIEHETGCRIWVGSTNNRGYGLMYMDGRPRLAHRVAFYLANGRWPAEGLVVDHKCGVKACVNPLHLQEMSNWENLRRPYDRSDPTRETRRAMWRSANARRRNYSSAYEVGG